MSAPHRICLLSGGMNAEASASRTSAAGVHDALAQRGYEVVWLDLSESHEWAVRRGRASAAVHGDADRGRSWQDALAALAHAHEIELVFPTIHGPIGEDGRLQTLCESLGVPWVGCDARASETCYDKVRFKQVVRAARLPVAASIEIGRAEHEADPAAAAEAVACTLGYPCIVKPSRSGSSLGLARADAREQLDAAIAQALRFDDVVLVERLFPGLDIEIGVIQDETSAVIVGSPVELEYEGLYDYETKYAGDRDLRYLPARFPGPLLERLRDAAYDAFAATGCSGLARVDLLVNPGTQAFVVNEINTIPYMPASSTFATSLCHTTGTTYHDLLDTIVQVAWSRG